MGFPHSRALLKLTLNPPRGPRSPCPVGSMWQWHQMTPCSWPPRLKPRPMQAWVHSCQSHQQNPPWSGPVCVAASATPHYLGNWTSPQDYLRSRNTCQTLCCRSSEVVRKKNFPSNQQCDFESTTTLLLYRLLQTARLVLYNCNMTSLIFRYHNTFGQCVLRLKPLS